MLVYLPQFHFFAPVYLLLSDSFLRSFFCLAILLFVFLILFLLLTPQRLFLQKGLPFLFPFLGLSFLLFLRIFAEIRGPRWGAEYRRDFIYSRSFRFRFRPRNRWFALLRLRLLPEICSCDWFFIVLEMGTTFWKHTRFLVVFIVSIFSLRESLASILIPFLLDQKS